MNATIPTLQRAQLLAVEWVQTVMRFVLLLCAAPLWAQTYNFSEVDAILTGAQSRLNTGLVLTLTQHGRVVYQKAFGNLNPTQPIFIASASKWLSGAVVMSVVDEGRISLDDPLSRYLPYFIGDKAPITVRQAFSHTSGLPDGVPCLNDRTTTLDACARQIAQAQLLSPPGTQFYYGGSSMQAAGRALEVVTGRAFTQLFQERIATPLGMTFTSAALPGRDTNPMVAGGYYSSAADYSRFLLMILNRGAIDGRRVLSAASVIEMQKDQTAGAAITYSPYQQLDPFVPGIGLTRYGVGEWLQRVQDGSVREVGSQGAFGFSPWVDLDRNLTGVLAVQDQLHDVEPYYLRLKDAIARIVPIAPLSSRGVTNAGSFAMGAMAPGELVTLFGQNLGPAQLVLTPTLNMPTELAGTRVWMDGAAVPLLYTSATQVTALVPASVAGRAVVTIEVDYGGVRAGPIVMPIESAAPGLFGIAIDRGVALIFGTGAPSGHVGLAVSIGGQAARVNYAGPAPGIVDGVFQINAVIPPGALGGAPVVVRYGPFASQSLPLPQ